MKNPKVRLILSLAAMFVLGAISGVGLTMFCHPLFGPPQPGKLAKHFQNFLTSRLDLTADQQEKLKPIATDFAAQAEKLHDDSMQQMKQLANATDDRVSALLTPDQKAKLDELRKQRDADFGNHSHWMGGWGPGPHDMGGSNDAGGPPPPPPGK